MGGVDVDESGDLGLKRETSHCQSVVGGEVDREAELEGAKGVGEARRTVYPVRRRLAYTWYFSRLIFPLSPSWPMKREYAACRLSGMPRS